MANTNYYYFVIATEDNGKYYAHAWRHPENNILNLVAQFPKAHIIHPVKTMTKAKELATAWNDNYKANGNYMFNNTPLF